jgi:hypothetical protein
MDEHLPTTSCPEPAPDVRHSYPLAVERADLGTAVGLFVKTLPYALVRLAILVGCTAAAVVAWVVAFGGAAFLGEHVGGWAGLVWLLLCAAASGGVWRFALRYVLYLAKCGHVAVLTELITRGRIGNQGEGMFAYGKRIVTERFVEVNVLFAVDQLVKGVVSAFNRAFDGLVGLLPVPGLDGLARIVNAIVRAATTYIDETLFSYRLARGEGNPWETARDGLVYYGQNAREVLKTALWVVVLDKVLTAVAWAVCLAPGFLIAAAMPGKAGLFAVGLGLLLALNLRSAFLKPLFLIMVMTKFHVCVRGQAIDAAWDARLGAASEGFRQIGERARSWVAGPAPVARPAPAPTP